MTTSQPRNPFTGQFVSADDPYQRMLENIAYANSAAPPPTSIPRDFETEQRIHNEQLMRAARRRELDRSVVAARERERRFIEQRQKERDDQQRINSVEAWHVAEEQARKEYVAAGGFIEDFKFDREAWVRSEQERGERIARRMPSYGAI